MRSTLIRSSLVIAGLLLLAGTSAEAQLTGLKNRAKKIMEGSAEKPVAVAYNEHVLEVTPAVLERFERALAAEEAERNEVARIAASVRTPEDYQACMMKAVMSPEAQALMAASSAKGEAYIASPRDQAAAAAYRKAQQDLVEYMSRTCGPDPDQFRSSELPKLQARPAEAGREAGGFTVTQYAILKERVAPLCGMAEAAGSDGIKIPGEGKNIFWVYSPVEVEALLPRCAELSQRVGAGL